MFKFVKFKYFFNHFKVFKEADFVFSWFRIIPDFNYSENRRNIEFFSKNSFKKVKYFFYKCYIFKCIIFLIPLFPNFLGSGKLGL